MATSREMKEVYDAMERICFETGDLLKALDDLMQKQGFTFTKTELRWDMSKAVDKPDSWLPYFSQRIYRKMPNDEKVIGVNIMFKTFAPDNKLFFISCGRIDGRNAGSKSDQFYSAGWNEGDKPQQIPDTKIYHTIFKDCKIWNYFIPLHIVIDLETLEKYIVKPLIGLYNSGPNPEKEVSIDPFGLTFKDIKVD